MNPMQRLIEAALAMEMACIDCNINLTDPVAYKAFKDLIGANRAIEAAVRAGGVCKVKLPDRRYLKNRAWGDETFSDHSQGWDDALDACEQALREAGVEMEGEGDEV